MKSTTQTKRQRRPDPSGMMSNSVPASRSIGGGSGRSNGSGSFDDDSNGDDLIGKLVARKRFTRLIFIFAGGLVAIYLASSSTRLNYLNVMLSTTTITKTTIITKDETRKEAAITNSESGAAAIADKMRNSAAEPTTEKLLLEKQGAAVVSRTDAVIETTPSLKGTSQKTEGATPSLKGSEILSSSKVTATTTIPSHQKQKPALKPINVTVYLTAETTNPADSIFKTRTLERYGSGRIQHYDIRRGQCKCDDTIQAAARAVKGPCLAVSKKCPANTLKCRYPQCKTVITNDEYCKHGEYDVREYYSKQMANHSYIPLGPRLDSWTSFQKVQQEQGDQFTILPASKRKYVFNAIFSKDTNEGRGQLANIIESHDNSNWNIFTKMAEKWVREVNDPNSKSGHLNTDSYIQVVLDSTFTLAPTGHNPECFRLFEAIEAGSIPVVARDKDYFHQKCQRALYHWFDVEPKAPIVVLQSWDDVYPTLEKLLKDPAALDERQSQLSAWYQNHMRKVTAEFESFVLHG